MSRTMLVVVGIMLICRVSEAEDIRYRSFSASAAIGPPADTFTTKLQTVTRTALGPDEELHFIRLAGLPAIPAAFGGDIVSAVAAGEANGGFNAAYISGGDLNKTWGFIFNSGVPFGPTFDEFIGFLYGHSFDDGSTGLDTVQALLAKRGVVAFPIVGSPEQLSGYFPEPMGEVHGHHGIGLAGLCEQHWILRYLPPGQDVISGACDRLVAEGRIAHKNITFIAAIPGGGSLVDGLLAHTLNGFEFATPLDDVSQLFATINNPGTAGARFVHTPGWQQQFLITWMIINKSVWSALTPGQQTLMQTVARDHVLTSYGENLRQQGAALQFILDANKGDQDHELVMSKWPLADQMRLRNATIRFLNARVDDATLPTGDRADYMRILEALRGYVRANDHYWDHRQVPTQIRFDDWANKIGECWEAKCDTRK